MAKIAGGRGGVGGDATDGHNNLKFNNQEEDEIDNLYINSIKAKLALIQK